MSLREREKIQEVLRGVSDGEPVEYKHRMVKLAGIQFSATGSKDQNMKRAREFAKVALDKGAQLICFSELFSLPWFEADDTNYSQHAEEVPGPSTEAFLPLLQNQDAVILCPVFEKTSSGGYNSVAMVTKHGIRTVYRKIHVPELPFWEERNFFRPGDMGLPVIETPHARIGIQIGWDNFFPEASRIMAMNGAEILFCPTAAAFDSQFRWEAVISANAIVNSVFAFRINRVGLDSCLHFYGKSFCVDPFGEFVAKPAFDKDAIIMTDVDLSVLRAAKEEFPFFQDRRPGLYKGILDES